MDYLKQFGKDFFEGKIKIREHYCNPRKNVGDETQVINDVVTDLIDYNLPVSAACLPIGKQIATTDNKITLKLPRIGDLFVGLAHQSVIDKVTFTLVNHLEEYVIEGSLQTLGNQSLWQFTDIPLPLITVHDYEQTYVNVNIDLNGSYNLQTANQDVFKAYYGYLNSQMRYQTVNRAVYELPVMNVKDLLFVKIICGLWTVKYPENVSG
jgi:hypothetical protein